MIQHHSGQAFALRRFDTARTTAKIVAMATEIWLSMPEHPAITRPREVSAIELLQTAMEGRGGGSGGGEGGEGGGNFVLCPSDRGIGFTELMDDIWAQRSLCF